MSNDTDTNRLPLEDALFTYGEVSEVGGLSLGYQDVVLKVPVADYPAGAKFEEAILDGERSLLVFKTETGFRGFKVSLVVGEETDVSDLVSQHVEEDEDHFHEGHACGHDHKPAVQG